MIVLAIAGLILLIVFLAIPALQRSQRNTGRKEDAGRLVTAIGDFVSNDGGTLPQSGNWVSSSTVTGGCETILNDAGKLNQGTWAANDCAIITSIIVKPFLFNFSLLRTASAPFAFTY